jgi:hypothetical protein
MVHFTEKTDIKSRPGETVFNMFQFFYKLLQSDYANLSVYVTGDFQFYIKK